MCPTFPLPRVNPRNYGRVTNASAQFSNLLGTVYCQGNLAFSPDGTLLYSPVGNKVTVFNLVESVLPLRHLSYSALLDCTAC